MINLLQQIFTKLKAQEMVIISLKCSNLLFFNIEGLEFIESVK